MNNIKNVKLVYKNTKFAIRVEYGISNNREITGTLTLSSGDCKK